MGLEDLAMFCAQPNFTVLYPSDATSTWRETELAAQIDGPVYLRLARPATPVLYDAGAKFESGRCKVLMQTPEDRVTIVTAGVTLFEAIRAHGILAEEGIPVRLIDLFSVQPLDRKTIRDAVAATGGRLVTVEDHYLHGGLGQAVCAAIADQGFTLRVRNLAVAEIPRSGTSDALLNRYGISAGHIVDAVRSLL
jgi:transketolase